MNYTPDELKCICLKRSFLDGYSKKQVDNLLVLINEDYTQFVRDNEELKSKVSVLTETLHHYKILEESLQHSILVAQHTSEQIKVNACEKAKIIIDEADMNAQKLISSANQEVIKTRGKYEEIKAQLFTFKTKSEALLLSQLEILKQMLVE
ncbi:MAG TPA: DivIVA domain-containing protein [Ruminiclostridium sp.]